MANLGGWDKETIERTVGESLELLEHCVKEVRFYLKEWREDINDETRSNWAKVADTTEMLREAILNAPRGLSKENMLAEQESVMRALLKAVNRLNTSLSANPAEMLRLANNLATLGQKMVTTTMAVDKHYGDVIANVESDYLQFLDPAQIRKVFEWVEENKRFQEMVKGDGN